MLDEGDIEKTIVELRNRRREMRSIGKETYIIKSEKKNNEKYGDNANQKDGESDCDCSSNGCGSGNSCSGCNGGSDNDSDKNKEASWNIVTDIDKGLIELKGDEPTSNNQFFRMSIIGYELGDLHRSIVYATRFKDDKKMRIAHLANGKLAMADLLTQLYLLCSTLEWDFNTLRKLGLDHLRERHGDFQRDGWSEVK